MSQDNSGLMIVIIAGVVISVLALYFLGNLFIFLGIAAIFISIIFLMISTENQDLLILGLIILGIGIVLLFLGFGIVGFFENNPTGQNLLGASNYVVNTTAQGIDTYNEITSAIK
jgi:membrane protein implicated in regulation of membrane protease activity